MPSTRRFAFALLPLLSLTGCTPPEAPPSAPGEALAQTYCTSCHLFPEPDLLGRSAWVEGVLPEMGNRLGHYATPRDSLIRRISWYDVDADRFYPLHPLLSKADWEAIVAFYTEEAPDTLVTPPRPVPVSVGLTNFALHVPGFRFRHPLTTLVRISEDGSRIYLGNYGINNALVTLSPNGQVQRLGLDGSPVDLEVEGERLFITVAGKGPEPTDAAFGTIQVVDTPADTARVLIDGLKRPVSTQRADLNADGEADFVVCEFGHYGGFVSWYEAAGDGSYTRHVLLEEAGAVKAAVHDFNGDARPDIGVLMAQGDEGFDLYLNLGNGQFERHRLLRFPPTYGSNDFDLADFDGDGRLDLLYVNGDNADFSIRPKPYHGVRIFLTAEDGTLHERFFFPLHGATRARAADFDGDGDLDVAAVAYFPDYVGAPGEGFMLLENQGELTFTSSTFEDAQRGRWITLDVGDLGGDGDPDIILGSNIGFGPHQDQTGLYERWARTAPSFIVLENIKGMTYPMRGK